MKLTITIILGIIISACNSCSHRKDMGFNQRPGEHKQLYSYPEKLLIHKEEPDPETKARYRRIVIASINDFEGKVEPRYFIKLDKRFNAKTTVASGGIAAIKAYSDILKEYYDGKVLLVDPGNFLNSHSNLDELTFYRNYLNFDAISLAAQDFTLPDYNFSKLKSLISKHKTPVVVSNAYALGEAAPLNWPNVKTHLIQTVGDIKVGFIGIVSPKNVLAQDKKHFTGLYFQDPTQVIMQQAAELRREGAQIVVTLFHSGIDCTSMLAHDEKLPPEKVNFKQDEVSYCDFYENELANTLKKLPPRTVDLVITGGKNSKVVNFVKGYPVIQNYGGGRYINWVELFYDTKLGTLDSEQTRLFQPVELCHQFIKKTEDCFTKDEVGDFDLEPAKFLGRPINIAPLPPITKK